MPNTRCRFLRKRVCVCVTNALQRTILSPQRHPPEPLPQDEVVAAASRLHQTCTQPPPFGPSVPRTRLSTPALPVDLLTPYSRVAWPAVNRVPYRRRSRSPCPRAIVRPPISRSVQAVPATLPKRRQNRISRRSPVCYMRCALKQDARELNPPPPPSRPAPPVVLASLLRQRCPCPRDL